MTNRDPVERALAAIRARQDAEHAYYRAKLQCIARGKPLLPAWAERRLERWRAWRRAVERDCTTWVAVMRELKGDK
jgi:hypothetical protein